MSSLTVFAQLIFTVVVGMYFLMRIKNDSAGEKALREEYVTEAEELNRLRHISLSEPMTEKSRPTELAEIIGQEDGIRGLKSALWGKHPQHVIIYGPPGVGKTAAARIVLEEVKKSPQTPFGENAPFIEVDATVMRCDEYGFTDPLIGSVHDPIYQGSGAFGQNGLPQPKPGAVTRAHGGILFIDEIGELSNMQINKLLKILEDRYVTLESSYYSRNNKKVPLYIRDAFENGFPADFRLIGATTEPPSKIPEAIRSRCTEIYFNPITRDDIVLILKNAAIRCGIHIDACAREIIAEYAENGRDAIKIMQQSSNLAKMDGRGIISVSDVLWTVKTGRYNKRNDINRESNERIVDISIIKPFN